MCIVSECIDTEPTNKSTNKNLIPLKRRRKELHRRYCLVFLSVCTLFCSHSFFSFCPIAVSCSSTFCFIQFSAFFFLSVLFIVRFWLRFLIGVFNHFSVFHCAAFELEIEQVRKRKNARASGIYSYLS